MITIDGSTGNVYAGEIPTVEAEFFPELATLLVLGRRRRPAAT